MNIRLATLKDLEQVIVLYKELRPNDPELEASYALSKWESILLDDSVFVVVAEIDGLLASTCMLGVVPTIANRARPFGIIEHVITAAKYRRKGMARLVLNYAIDLAWKYDCYKVVLLSGEEREPAHELYHSVGFKSGIEKGFVIKP